MAAGRLVTDFAPAPRAEPVGRVVVRAVRASTGAKKRPVWEAGSFATSSGVPSAMTNPPPDPPSGPRSMIQSALLITSRLCSITMIVLPCARKRC